MNEIAKNNERRTLMLQCFIQINNTSDKFKRPRRNDVISVIIALHNKKHMQCWSRIVTVTTF